MSSSTITPSIAAAAYAEPFIDGRRVVVFGNSESPLAQLLVERGARAVHVCDADAARAARAGERAASRSISFGGTNEASAALDRGFDFGIIENLVEAAASAEALQSLVRALATRGAALVGVPNADARLGLGLSVKADSSRPALSYYELYDQVAEHFSEVRMLGQLPFVGYAIADFSAEREADISVDTGFVPGGAEEPEWFWALCSQEPVIGEAFSIIQLPLSQVLAARTPQPTKSERVEDGPKAAKLNELQAKLLEREQAVAQLETQLSAANQRSGQLQKDLEHSRAQAAAKEATGKEAASTEAAAQKARWHAERDELLSRLQQAEDAARAPTPQDTGLAEDSAQASANDASSLEATLRERGEHVAQLEARLLEAERVVGDLVRELDTLRRHTPSETLAADPSQLSELQTKLDNLALANAERAALLASAEATIQQLEHKLQHLTAKASSGGADLELAEADLQRQLTLAAQQQASSGGELPS